MSPSEPFPFLHIEVAQRLAARLEYLRELPKRIEVWNPDGVPPAVRPQLGLRVLRAGGRASTLSSGPTSEPTGHEPGWWQRLGRRAARLLPSAQRSGPMDPGGPGAADLLWSNLDLHRVGHPDALLARWLSAIRIDGLLLFSTYGPGTLRELQSLWGQEGWGPVCQPYIDMHDWGDALVRAGFADPVMDQETLRLSWPDPQSALLELRSLGRNAHPHRHAGCRSRAWRQRMLDALSGLRGADGRITLSFEIVYGHAVRPLPQVPVSPIATISVQDLRTLAKTTRRRD